MRRWTFSKRSVHGGRGHENVRERGHRAFRSARRRLVRDAPSESAIARGPMTVRFPHRPGSATACAAHANTARAPELAVRSELHRRGLRFRVQRPLEFDSRRKADIVFPERTTGRLHRRLLLALMPRTRDPPEGERAILGRQTRPQRQPRPRHRPSPRRSVAGQSYVSGSTKPPRAADVIEAGSRLGGSASQGVRAKAATHADEAQRGAQKLGPGEGRQSGAIASQGDRQVLGRDAGRVPRGTPARARTRQHGTRGDRRRLRPPTAVRTDPERRRRAPRRRRARSTWSSPTMRSTARTRASRSASTEWAHCSLPTSVRRQGVEIGRFGLGFKSVLGDHDPPRGLQPFRIDRVRSDRGRRTDQEGRSRGRTDAGAPYRVRDRRTGSRGGRRDPRRAHVVGDDGRAAGRRHRATAPGCPTISPSSRASSSSSRATSPNSSSKTARTGELGRSPPTRRTASSCSSPTATRRVGACSPPSTR